MKLTAAEVALLFSSNPAAPERASTVEALSADPFETSPTASRGETTLAAPIAQDCHRGALERSVPDDADPVSLLRRVGPSLFAKAARPNLTRREQRDRLLELLAWLLGKYGWSPVGRLQRYDANDRTVEGRLDLAMSHGDGRELALEVAFEPAARTVAKLEAAAQAGRVAVLVCPFAPHAATARVALAAKGAPPTRDVHLVAVGR